MTKLIGVPLGYIMFACYYVVSNYGVALILFTLVTKLILFPLSVKQQKNTAKMASFNPKLEKLKKKHGTNKEKYQEEMMKLYAEEGYNPMGSCLPLLIQMPILFGLIDVVYRPLTHILRISSSAIIAAEKIIKDSKIEALVEIAKNKNFKSRPELYIMQAVDKVPAAFSDNLVEKLQGFDYSFLTIPLGSNPSWTLPLVLIPLLSGLFNLVSMIYTQRLAKKNNQSMQQMSNGMNAMLYMTPIFSVVFAFSVPAGVGLYWIISSVFIILQTTILYRIYTPERVAVLLKKDAEKKKNKKPGMYQRAVLQAQEQKNAANGTTSSATIIESDDDESEDKLSKSAIKELQRKKLAEARKRMAEKYGDEYDDSTE